MKILILIGIILFLAFAVFAQCAEPVLENTGSVVVSKTFSVGKNSAGEVYLSLEAAAKNFSWEKKDSEAAALTIFTDGKYNQDMLLFAGAEKFTYHLMLGKFAVGKHSLNWFFRSFGAIR